MASIGGFFKGLGKGLLKVAPYAALAIPGVGPIASAAIGAGLGAANAKASGAGLKGTLLGAGLGALPTKGLGPSAGAGNYVKEGVASTAKKIAGGGVKSALGNFAKQTGKNVLAGVLGGDQSGIDQYRTPPFVPQTDMVGAGSRTGGNDWKSIVGNAVNRYGPSVIGAVANRGGGNAVPRTPSSGAATVGNASPRGGNLMRGLGPTMGRRDQSNPNLAESIGAGRQTAMKDQPFRRGYDVKTVTGYNEDDTPIITTSRMPRMSGANMSRGNKRREAYQ